MNLKSKLQVITFISLVIDLLGFTVILPLFPTILQYYAKNDSSGLYGILETTIIKFQTFLNVPKEFNVVLFGGVLGSLFSFLQFISSPIFGSLSDYYGRKIILLWCLTGVTASYGLWFIASNFALFVFSRIIGGLFKGNVSLSYSIMTDLSSFESRSKGMALIGIAFSIGFIVGPVVGVGFSRWGSTGWYSASAFYAFTLAIFNFVFVSFFFEETLPQEKRLQSIKSGFAEACKFINPKQLFNFKPIQKISNKDRIHLSRLGLIYFLYLFVYSGLEFTITFVTHYYHGFDSMAQGKMFAYLGVLMALIQGGFVRKIKAGLEKRMSIIGFLFIIPSFFMIGILSSKLGLYAGLTLYAFGSSLMVPCLTALASQFGPTSQKGTVLGIWRSLGALARALGPIVACFGFWIFGSGLTYVLGGLFLIIPLKLLSDLNVEKSRD